MKMRIGYWIFILFLVQEGCQGPSNKDPKLKEAFEVHEQYVKVATESLKLLDNLPAENVSRQKLNLKLEQWGENIIEVPGFPHNHNHAFGHHHHHGVQIQLSPEEMLDVQKELLDSVIAIRQRILSIDLE